MDTLFSCLPPTCQVPLNPKEWGGEGGVGAVPLSSEPLDSSAYQDGEDRGSGHATG